ncbi:MAG: UDP-N-acetylglucosamine 1-carboxyvinyltransferase [Bacilli bacterium]|nr:UDP-N-acetylglucosamine 1-carboxyvinyltransferase [Bacilli bacterium]
MKELIIHGGKQLSGKVKISGAKNSAVALIPAALLSDETVTIDNIPNISDIDALNEILKYLNADVKREGETIYIDSSHIQNKEVPREISSKLRASYYFMSALLGKYKKVEMYFPGGCSIGARPIDQTLKAFRALGATVVEKDNRFSITAERLVGASISLDMASVGATINTILASVRAEGQTVIYNAAKEPEIVNVATFLNNMGARIEGAGTSTIKIYGVSSLKGCFHEVIPDRIEAGTYVIMGALLGNPLRIEGIIPEHIKSLTNKLEQMGSKIKIEADAIEIEASDLKADAIKTLGYPGFPTDLQQPFTALLTQCDGTSSVEENLYENRFGNVPYLNDMGAKIDILDKTNILVTGKTALHGTKVKATDLRAGACMVIAGLVADGKTTVLDVEHVLRGYENIVTKLTDIGAKIELKEI